MASDEVVKADLLQRNSQLRSQQEKQHKLLGVLCRRLAIFVTLESALECERSQMTELNRLAFSARNLCEEILRCASDRASASSSHHASTAAAEERGLRLLHQVLAPDSRLRPSEFLPKRDVIALAERHGAQARAMASSNAGVGSNCDAEVEQCKAAAGVLQAVLHNDFQQPELLSPEVSLCCTVAFEINPSHTACLKVLKMYETLVAETDSRFSEAEVVFKERQQQQHSFSRLSLPRPSMPLNLNSTKTQSFPPISGLEPLTRSCVSLWPCSTHNRYLSRAPSPTQYHSPSSPAFVLTQR